MAESFQLNRPWLVAVWPGMGHVALNAGVYLLAKLGMTAVAEVEAAELFDVDHVEVSGGLIQPARRPRNRLFVWKDPNEVRDLVVFVGEAQPPLGKFPFCRQLVTYARRLGVERVFTFAAMATRMRPDQDSRVFAAATDRANLDDLRRLDLEVLEGGHIGGLNGVLLAAAAEAGLHGACLLGEMPHFLAQLPYPKASLATLRAFAAAADLDLDLTELEEQARAMDEQLAELMARVEEQADDGEAEDEDEGLPSPPAAEDRVAAADRDRVEELFDRAEADRSKAFELKRELDRLGLFKEYEDRFLDLFKRPS